MDYKHGGHRPGAGRKKIKGAKLTKENSKVARINLTDYKRIKSGTYEQIINTLYDYKCQSEDASKTSPKYEKLRQFLTEIEEVLGSDYDSWIE